MDSNCQGSAACGRYAPSPTGRLHLGNLQTALLAWLQARLMGGRFILRMDDLDQPRIRPGAQQQILEDLAWMGLDWDEGPDVGGANGPYLQSQRTRYYAQALDTLGKHKKIFACFCSRKDIALAVGAPHPGDRNQPYPGTCRANLYPGGHQTANPDDKKPLSWRYCVGDRKIVFDDLVCGRQEQDLATDAGDFVVKRKDGQFAYQLTTVVDDGLMGVSDVVRGADLLSSTHRQIALISDLGFSKPRFWHMPLVYDFRNRRMSKRDGSDSLEQWQSAGKTAPQLIGEFAYPLGLIDQPGPLSTQELLASLDSTGFQEALRCLRTGKTAGQWQC
ncbi:MAG: tRNA glutamyl-Q(34) synthetase GluQRS [Gammaproteobacteria bacterium]|nr:tRNA glutamyl-Q(34) synthetase GluQRS [Gammaproteobacteria bacterium]